MAATIIDVARKAGVSTATVSHVVNGTRYVSEDLRQKVLQAMEQLNYRQNTLARGLRMGSTKTIGLIVPDNSNPFFAELLRTIETIGFSRGYNVILCNTDNDVKKEAAYISLLNAKQVDGIIFITTCTSQETLGLLVHQQIPMVVIDREVAVQGVDVILVDNYSGGYQAAQHLIQLGHTRIACMTGPSHVTPSADRVRGYTRALQDAGLPVFRSNLVEGDFSFQSGEAGLDRLLDLPQPPTAVFACNDMMALGAVQALRRRGLLCPGDVSIAGFDNIPLSSMISPTLTTVAQPVQDVAGLAVNLLMNRIQKEEDLPPQRIILPAQLLVRESTARRTPSGEAAAVDTQARREPSR